MRVASLTRSIRSCVDARSPRRKVNKVFRGRRDHVITMYDPNTIVFFLPVAWPASGGHCFENTMVAMVAMVKSVEFCDGSRRIGFSSLAAFSGLGLEGSLD
jgi:hypothetical protein